MHFFSEIAEEFHYYSFMNTQRITRRTKARYQSLISRLQFLLLPQIENVIYNSIAVSLISVNFCHMAKWQK